MVGIGELGNLANLMKSAQELQKKMAALEQRLAGETVVGSAGGDMVRVTANCRSQIVAVEIDPSLFTAEEREMAQELVASATNQALARAKERAQNEITALLGGLGLPPGMLNLPGFGAG